MFRVGRTACSREPGEEGAESQRLCRLEPGGLAEQWLTHIIGRHRGRIELRLCGAHSRGSSTSEGCPSIIAASAGVLGSSFGREGSQASVECATVSEAPLQGLPEGCARNVLEHAWEQRSAAPSREAYLCPKWATGGRRPPQISVLLNVQPFDQGRGHR